MAVLALIQCEVMMAIVLVNGRRNIRLGRQSLREALVFLSFLIEFSSNLVGLAMVLEMSDKGGIH